MMVAIACCRDGFAEAPRVHRDSPAALFALVAPNALVTTNAAGYQLMSQGGRTLRATARGRDWVFTSDDGSSVTAERDQAGWTLTAGGRKVGRVDKNQAILQGERRTVTWTQDGFITSTSTTRSAEAFFEHRYRK